MWKNVHPVSSTGIQTHNLLIMSLLPKPLCQGSRPSSRYFFLAYLNVKMVLNREMCVEALEQSSLIVWSY